MMYSTIRRFAGLGLLVLVLVIALSGYALMSPKVKDTLTTQNMDSASEQQATSTPLEFDDESESPVVKLASLSIITDYPETQDQSLMTNIGMNVEERIISARKLAADQKYEEALRMLKTAPSTDQEAYSLNYMQAQILSWSGQHDRATTAFTKLREDYPQDADIAVSFGYLHLYQENFEEAERLFSQVLDRFPDYQDAQQGLKRATAIQ